MNKYEELFVGERQHSYEEAMQSIAPKARDQEFQVALKFAGNHNEARILDFPSGGGYLQNYTQGTVIECDPAGWGNGNALEDHEAEAYDVLISIAGLHHYTLLERQALYAEFFRLVKGDGKLVVSEVPPESHVARFLNEFVHQYNSGGHEGLFLEEADLHALNSAGFVSERTTEKYEWVFDSEDQLLDFTKSLFGLDKASRDDIRAGLDAYFTLNGYNLPWEMNIYECVKQS